MKFRSIIIAAMIALPAAAQGPSAAAAKTAEPVAAPAPAATPFKVAVIRFQDAVLSTQEGQKASAALRAKFDPKKADIEKRQADLQAMQEKLQKGTATMSPEARSKMQEDLARGSRNLQHDVDDLNSELQEDEGKMMQDIAGKMSELLQKYATQNGYAVVLDVSSQQTPVLWADAAANITPDIVKQYDAAHPVKSAAAAPAK